VAEGLAAGNPGRKGDWVLRWLRDESGLAADAEDEDILTAQRRLARTEGIWAGPTGVTPLAVLIKLLAEERIDPDQRFGVILTETGLKTEAALPARQGVAHDYASLRRLVEERLARAAAST
jgi:threonine synthase